MTHRRTAWRAFIFIFVMGCQMTTEEARPELAVTEMSSNNKSVRPSPSHLNAPPIMRPIFITKGKPMPENPSRLLSAAAPPPMTIYSTIGPPM